MQQQPKYAKFDEFFLLMLPNKCLAREIKKIQKINMKITHTLFILTSHTCSK